MQFADTVIDQLWEVWRISQVDKWERESALLAEIWGLTAPAYTLHLNVNYGLCQF